uniref:PNPLA domain-containing protein n=1 Tax=Mola mola TaxID=94237 RepID=A0A3Q3WD30_MOLML
MRCPAVVIIYHVGVAQCLLNYAPWILRTAPCVLGASAGSLVAAAMLHFAKQMKTFTLGPFNPSINVLHWLEFILHKHLPSNAHQLATGRLAVAVTRMTDRKPVIMSDFGSKEDVALLCSCFVPGYCGMMAPSYKGIYYVDGGFSNMQPGLPLPYRQILTVCPFSGEMDICPTDTFSMLDMVVAGATLKGSVANSIRFFNALYPMPLEKAYESGYKDAIDFLLNNGVPTVFTVNSLELKIL